MSQKYQREIEDILRQAGEQGGKGSRKSKTGLLRLLWSYVTQQLGGRGLSVTPGRVMLIAFVMLLSALVFNTAVPGFGFVGLLGWSGFILLIVGYAMFFIRPRPIEKRWRGETIEYDGEPWWNRLRKKMK